MADSSPDFARIRAEEFNWSGADVFLNAASFGPLPMRTVRVMEHLARRRNAPFDLKDEEVPQTLAGARAAAAALIGADPAQIALTPNTTIGLNLAASFLARDRRHGGLAHRITGRKVLISDREFPANVYPWAWLRRSGVDVERIASDPLGRPDEDALLQALQSGDVGVLALSAVQFSSGFRADLGRIGDACRRNGVLFVVDAIQSLGAQPLNALECGIDMLSTGAQKWLCSPWGTGFVYVRDELLRELEPPQPGWLSFTSSLNFASLLDYGEDLLPDARRFEVGTLALQSYAAMTESIGLLLEIGIDAIWRHIREVQQPLIEWALAGGATVVSPVDGHHRSAIVCIRFDDAARVHAALADRGVICALREGAIRFSPHFYNTREEMHRVVETLERNA